jgi:NADH-quinone oxidoreductase subunit J
MIMTVYFSFFAIIAVLCAAYLLIAKHPLQGALALIGVMLSIAGIYSILAAPFLGVVQILTYAGAIMMLVVFVIMVLNSAHDHVVPRFDRKGIILLIIPVIIFIGLLSVLQVNVFSPHPTALRGTAQTVSTHLFDTTQTGGVYWILFEFTGLILLASMAAAVLLAKKRLANPGEKA